MSDVGARLERGPGLLLGGGTALDLMGEVAFRRALDIQSARSRTVAAVVSLCSLAMGEYLNAGIELVFLAVVRPIIPAGQPAHVRGTRHRLDDLVWDDRAEQDATQLVGLLFVAAAPDAAHRRGRDAQSE